MVRYNCKLHGEDMYVFELQDEEPMKKNGEWKDGECPMPTDWITRHLIKHLNLSPRVMWEIGGPPGTKIAWITCYECGKMVFIIQTFRDSKEKDPSFEVFLPSRSSTRVGSLKDLVDLLRSG